MAARKPRPSAAPVARKPHALPMVIYVTRRQGDPAPYLEAHAVFDSPDTFEDGDEVGVYHLHTTRRYVIQRTLR